MSTMSKGEKTREKIITEASFLFLSQGYSETSISDILERVGISKGTFYFHFKTKQDLVQSVAEMYGDEKMKEITSYTINANWQGFVESLIDTEIEKAENQTNFGCPNGLLGSELSYTLPEVSEQFYQNIENQIILFQQVIEQEGISIEESKVLSERAFALYEGRLLLYRMTHDVNNLIKLKEDLKALF